MRITNAQIQKIHALLPPEVKEDKELKASVVVQYTKDDTKTSTKDLSFEQANSFIKDLGGNPVGDVWQWFNYNNRQHRYILSLLQQAGWVGYDSHKKRHFADMERFAKWLQSPRAPVQKPLTQQSQKEVSKTIYALENILEFSLSKVKRN